MCALIDFGNVYPRLLLNSAYSDFKAVLNLHYISQVSRLAQCLVQLGVQPGDRVLIYMPMILEVWYFVLITKYLLNFTVKI